MPSDISSYKLVILDLDTVDDPISTGEYLLVGVSENKISKASAFDHTLQYPFVLSELRGLIFESLRRVTDRKNVIREDKIFYADESRRTVDFGGMRLTLSDYEFRVLKRLCDTPRIPVSREELSALFEGSQREGDRSRGNMADVYICHLRRKLESVSGKKIIYTVRGKGYMTEYSME